MSQHQDKNGQVVEAGAAPGAAGASAEAAGADPAPDLEALLRKAEDEAAGLKDAWLRARAEMENVRKQASLELTKAHKYAIERFAEDLLPVRDALEQTLAATAAGTKPEALTAGVELTLRKIESAFDKANLKEVDPAGARFDPHEHEAVQMVESDSPPGTVVQVFRKGYRLGDRILRTAMVAVAKSRDGND